MYPNRRQSSLFTTSPPLPPDNNVIITRSPSIQSTTLVLNRNTPVTTDHQPLSQESAAGWGPFTPTFSSTDVSAQALNLTSHRPRTLQRASEQAVHIAVSDAEALDLAIRVANGQGFNQGSSEDIQSTRQSSTSIDGRSRLSTTDHLTSSLKTAGSSSMLFNSSLGSLPSIIVSDISASTQNRAEQAKKYLSDRYAHIESVDVYNPLAALRHRVTLENTQVPHSRFGGVKNALNSISFPFGRKRRLCFWEVDNAELSAPVDENISTQASPKQLSSLHLSASPNSQVRLVSNTHPLSLNGEFSEPISIHSNSSAISSSNADFKPSEADSIEPKDVTHLITQGKLKLAVPITTQEKLGSPRTPKTHASMKSMDSFTDSPQQQIIKKNIERQIQFDTPIDAGIDSTTLWGGQDVPPRKDIHFELQATTLVPGQIIQGVTEINERTDTLLDQIMATKLDLAEFRKDLNTLSDPETAPLMLFKDIQELGLGLDEWDKSLIATGTIVQSAYDQVRDIEAVNDELRALIEDLEWAVGGEYLQTMKRLEDAIQGRSTARWRRDDTVLETAYTLLSYLLAGLAFILWAVLLVIRVIRRIVAFITYPIWYICTRLKGTVTKPEPRTLASSTSNSWMGTSISDAMAAASGEMINGFGSAADKRMTEQLERFINPDEWKSRIEQLFDFSVALSPNTAPKSPQAGLDTAPDSTADDLTESLIKP